MLATKRDGNRYQQHADGHQHQPGLNAVRAGVLAPFVAGVEQDGKRNDVRHADGQLRVVANQGEGHEGRRYGDDGHQHTGQRADEVFAL